ncbi:MAG: protein kinase [bacterium]
MKNPFVAGSWVRGPSFFGREKIVREILDGERTCLWVAGTRRLGKTSLLKQLELLSTRGPYADKFVPLFWDMQGSQNLEGLKESLLESIEDAEERFADIGVDIAGLEEQDVFGILRTARRRAKDRNLTLLLLCDETEELINVERNNPEALPKLRRILQQGENILTVLTATRRLSKLESSSVPSTSPFLYGFVPPVYLTPLDESQARQLIGLGNFPEAVVSDIIKKTNQHPYLMQLICRRLFESHDLEAVTEELCADEMVAHFFSVDFQCLEPKEKEILLYILQNEGLSLLDLQKLFSERLLQHLYELSQLGFIKKGNAHYEVANFFFRTWLQREKEKLFTKSTLKRAGTTGKTPTSRVMSTSIPQLHDRLGQHDILEKLGRGGMGIVFKGRDVQLDRLVALKVLSPQLMDDPEFKKRFLQEARAASAMNHPNITTIYQIGEDQGVVFIAMEYVDGHNLRDWRAKHAADLNAQVGVAIQVAEGLAHAHGKKIVHRDVKSDNILITHDNQAKIMDFGLAKSMTTPDMHLTRSGTTLGTLSYMSPEQASGLKTDHRTDVFSFGVVLYELFTGLLPFNGDYELSVLYAILNEEPEPVRKLNPSIPEQLTHIVSRALSKNKEKRYQAMEELVGELRTALARLSDTDSARPFP